MADGIVLRDDLREILESNAQQESRTLNDIVNEAVGLYVHRMQQAKIDREVEAYEQMHDSLRDRFLGQWVAIHNQQLVDHDADRDVLHRRIRDKYGRTSVLIRRVSESPIHEIWMRTPSTGKRAP
jgi:frataxin-like iron-binding protein CyaY